MTTFISRRELLRRAGLAGAVAVVAPALSSADADAVSAQADARRRSTAGARAARTPHHRRSRRPRRHRRSAHPERCERSRRARSRRDPLHRPRARRRARVVAPGVRAPAWPRSISTRAHRAASRSSDCLGRRSGCGADRGRGWSGDRFRRRIGGVLRLVRAHTIQGTFCDPYYGGNANFVGWDLIGYPGVRTIATAGRAAPGRRRPSQPQIGVRLRHVHKG